MLSCSACLWSPKRFSRTSPARAVCVLMLDISPPILRKKNVSLEQNGKSHFCRTMVCTKIWYMRGWKTWLFSQFGKKSVALTEIYLNVFLKTEKWDFPMNEISIRKGFCQWLQNRFFVTRLYKAWKKEVENAFFSPQLDRRETPVFAHLPPPPIINKTR